MPKISVIMPVYNGEKYLRESIDSILNQTFSDFEFIIIDDGSTDETESIIKSYDDKRIKYIKNEKNLGVAESLNKGLDLSQGEYVARMDADDISMPNRFEKQLKYMERHKNIAVCGTAIERFGEVKNSNAYNVANTEKAKIEFLFTSCLFHPTVIMRRSLVEKEHFRYDYRFEKVEDFELWTRIVSRYNISNLKDVLLKYRVHKNQVTQNYNEKYKNMLSEVKRKYLKAFGIELNSNEVQAFNDYFLETIDYNKQVKDLILALRKIVEGNKKTVFFKDTFLKRKFSGIVLNSVSLQSSHARKELIKTAGFITVWDIWKYTVKNLIKRVIGRN